MVEFEPLEGRLLLAADPGNTPKTALNLGNIAGVRSTFQDLAANDTGDMFRFRVAERGNVNILLSNLAAGAQVELIKGTGGRVLKTDSANAGQRGRISKELRAGAYYVRVTRTGAAATPYRLKIIADLNWGTIEQNGETHEVGLVWPGSTHRAVKAGQQTWVVIHGWNSSTTGLAMGRLAQAIDAAPGTQVLMLDWSESAKTANILDAASWIPEVSEFAARTLSRWGLGAPQINLAGFSLGGWVSGVLAQDIKGGVNRILALDPATDPSPFFVSDLDYARDSRFSASFIGSSWSTPAAAGTADYAFRLNVGDFGSIVTHANVVELVASMIGENYTGSPDRISRLFSLEKLSPGVAQPYRPNTFEGRYEATISGSSSGGVWNPTSMQYKDRKTGNSVTVLP